MANLRYVKTKTWDDVWFHALSPEAKLLFLYLITNMRTSLSGYYEGNTDTFSNDTGIPKKKIEVVMKELKGKIDYIDGWVCIKNYAQHQNAANSPKIQKLIEYDLEKVPQSVRNKHSTFYILHSDGIDRVSIPYTSPIKKEEETAEKHSFGEFKNVKLTIEEKDKLKELYGVSVAKKLVEDLSLYIKSNGYERKYKDHYATLRAWARRDKIPMLEKPKEVKKEAERPMTPEEQRKSEEMRAKVGAFVRTGMKKMPKTE